MLTNGASIIMYNYVEFITMPLATSQKHRYATTLLAKLLQQDLQGDPFQGEDVGS